MQLPARKRKGVRALHSPWACVEDVVGAGVDFVKEGHLDHAAALSFYAIFSLPPFSILLFSVAASVFQDSTAKAQLYDFLDDIIGSNAAHLLSDNLASVAGESQSLVTTTISVVALLFTSSSVFSTLQHVLNQVFGIPEHHAKRHAVLLFLRRRLIAVALILLLSVALIVSMLLDAGMALLSGWLARHLRFSLEELPWLSSQAFSLFSLWLLCLVLYRVLPDSKIPWAQSCTGALLSVLLFALAKVPIRAYLSDTHPENIYHAAGSIVIMMIWIHCASAALLLGALFAERRLKRRGKSLAAQP